LIQVLDDLSGSNGVMISNSVLKPSRFVRDVQCAKGVPAAAT
jgi:hypothetical protein